MKPLCFVLMPFGRKPEGGTGRLIDFDAVYNRIIAPAVEAAGMDVIRADQEQVGGTIHKPMFERLMLCDYAVADVTGANPNVYYELGIRHALRPRSTVIVFAEGTALPFDVASQRGTPYRMDASSNLTDVPRRRRAHPGRGWSTPMPTCTTTVRCSSSSTACRDTRSTTSRPTFSATASPSPRNTASGWPRRAASGIDAVRAVAADPNLADLRNVEAGIIVDLLLSFRAVGSADGCAEMIALYERMPQELQAGADDPRAVRLRAQPRGPQQDAESVLSDVINEFGQSSETNGLLGRIYKDQWEAAKKAGRDFEARGFLKRAIATYRAGFEADWRDPYPGVNAVTLMEMEDKPDAAQAELLPVVRYAASQRVRRTPNMPATTGTTRHCLSWPFSRATGTALPIARQTHSLLCASRGSRRRPRAISGLSARARQVARRGRRLDRRDRGGARTGGSPPEAAASRRRMRHPARVHASLRRDP